MNRSGAPGSGPAGDHGAAAPIDLDSLIRPRSVAILGASQDPNRHSGRCLANLERTGFGGRIFPVNPNREVIGRHRAYPSILDVDEDVEAAYILLPAAKVLQAVRDCAERGVRSAIVCTSGFAELGDEGRQAQEELVSVARESGLRLLGPNCIGVINVQDRYVGAPTLNITHEHTPGGISVLSHSGGIASIVFNRAQARGVGINTVVSLGNEADIEMAELVDALVDDPGTKVIGLVVEQLRDGVGFVRAARRARSAGKPMVVLKTGRSEAGKRMALGHTGALAGEAVVFTDVMRQLGVLEVTGIEEMVVACHALAVLPRPEGPRVGLLSPSGGESAYVADQAEDRGLVVPALAQDTVDRLRPLLPLGTPSNPLDTTGKVIGDRGLLDQVLHAFTADPNFDMALFAVPAWGDFDNERLLPAFVEAAQAADKPVVISQWEASGLTELGDKLLAGSPAVAFRSSDEALVALSALHAWHHASVSDVVAVAASPLAPVAEEGLFTERRAKLLLSPVVPTAEERWAGSPDAVADAARELGGTVVVKLMAEGVAHKADHGFVHVGIPTPDGAADAAEAMLQVAESLDCRVEGFLVARHLDGLEMIVGGVWDPTFGPVLMLGAGGILAEYLDDVAFRRCPIDRGEAERALAQLRVDRILRGARGRTYDVEALLDLVVDFSMLVASTDWIEEVDLNPVIVGSPGAGAHAVDAVLRTRSAPTTNSNGRVRR